MSYSPKHIIFILLGIAALLLTWPHAFAWMRAGGNIFNFVDFFGDAIAAGGTAAFLSIDMAVAWAVFMIWVVGDAQRIGQPLHQRVHARLAREVASRRRDGHAELALQATLN